MRFLLIAPAVRDGDIERVFESIETFDIRRLATLRGECLSEAQRRSLPTSLSSIAVSTSLEFSLWECRSSNIEQLSNALRAMGFHDASDSALTGNCVYCLDSALVNELGGLLFWDQRLNEDLFRTANKAILQHDYLPTLLAKDGEGIFFEERIMNRVVALGLLSNKDELVRLADLGGWQDLAHTIARLEVTARRSGRTIKETLVAIALTPLPPVTPEALSQFIGQQRAYLRLLDIETSVLASYGGVQYMRHVPFAISEYSNNVSSSNLREIVREVARLAALLDAGCFDDTRIRLATPDFGEISDYVEVSDVDSASSALHLDYLQVLRTDGERVYWSDLRRRLSSYRGEYSNACLARLMQWCPQKCRRDAREQYSSMLRECEDGWLNSKLLG